MRALTVLSVRLAALARDPSAGRAGSAAADPDGAAPAVAVSGPSAATGPVFTTGTSVSLPPPRRAPWTRRESALTQGRYLPLGASITTGVRSRISMSHHTDQLRT